MRLRHWCYQCAILARGLGCTRHTLLPRVSTWPLIRGRDSRESTGRHRQAGVAAPIILDNPRECSSNSLECARMSMRSCPDTNPISDFQSPHNSRASLNPAGHATRECGTGRGWASQPARFHRAASVLLHPDYKPDFKKMVRRLAGSNPPIKPGRVALRRRISQLPGRPGQVGAAQSRGAQPAGPPPAAGGRRPGRSTRPGS